MTFHPAFDVEYVCSFAFNMRFLSLHDETFFLGVSSKCRRSVHEGASAIYSAKSDEGAISSWKYKSMLSLVMKGIAQERAARVSAREKRTLIFQDQPRN
jgi:hypothetical protein